MLKGGWLIVHLIASAMSAPQAATAGSAGGASCTYQACMTKCSKLNGQICNSYCEAKVRQRVARGICAARDVGGG